MRRIAIAIFVALLVSANAQTPTPAIVVKRLEDAVIYGPKPEYPSSARSRHFEGSGVFMLHLRRDGTVESVRTLKSTGHRQLDDSAITALRQWRFHPGATKVKVPVAFGTHGLETKT